MHVARQVGAEERLDAFAHEGVEEEFAFVPDQAGHVVVEVGQELADALHADADVLPVGLCGEQLHVGDEQALAVGFIAVARHRDPGDVLAVGAPHGIRVVAAVRLDVDRGAGQDVIDVDGSVGAESILLTDLLAAGVDDVAVVGRPVQLLHAAERLGGQLEELVRAEDVDGVVRGDLAVAERGDVAARHVGHPMVPVAVHQVLGGVGLRLVQRGIAVLGGLQGRVLDGAHVDDLLLVGGELEVADSVGDVAELDALAELVALERGLPELAALQEEDALAVGGPAGAADALGEAGELDLAGAVCVAEEQVAAAAVGRDIGIGYAVQDSGAVGGQLGIGQAAEREQRLGRHHAVRDADVGRPDIAAIFFLGTTDCHNKTG